MTPRVLPARISERDLARFVADTAATFGWLRYHTHRSDHSPAGFPDETLVRGDRLVFAELKSDRPYAKPSPAQADWLAHLAGVTTVSTFLWRPADLDAIITTLR